MAKGRYLFTSEAVSMGHPDKLADQISDGILDACLEQDPMSRVACETMVTTGVAVIAGEITTKAIINYPDIVRKVINEVGYTDDQMGICGDTCAVMVSLDKQSPEIAQGVNDEAAAGKNVVFSFVNGSVAAHSSTNAGKDGAGDQGLMFGYACNDTPELMPLPIALAHRITNRLTEARQKGEVNWLRPDSKSQVTVEFEDNKPIRIDTVVVSTQHDPSVDQKQIAEWVIPNVIMPCLPAELDKGDIKFYINPTGKFVIGGPHGDCGLTGRKIIVDTYGGWASHGGGAFSGKDPTKVDRSAAYMARYIAKNIVAAGLADHCEVQLAYAIGVSEPVAVLVDTRETGKLTDEELTAIVRKEFKLNPSGIIETLDLRKPIFRATAAGGHFGRECFSWEKTNKVDDLKKYLK